MNQEQGGSLMSVSIDTRPLGRVRRRKTGLAEPNVRAVSSLLAAKLPDGVLPLNLVVSKGPSFKSLITAGSH